MKDKFQHPTAALRSGPAPQAPMSPMLSSLRLVMWALHISKLQAVLQTRSRWDPSRPLQEQLLPPGALASPLLPGEADLSF